jgi:hypothetical protein
MDVAQQRADALYHLRTWDPSCDVQMSAATLKLYKKVMGCNLIWGKFFLSKVCKKLRERYGLNRASSLTLVANHAKLPAYFPDHIRIRFFLLVHNGWLTGRRLDFDRISGKNHVNRCFLCKDSSEAKGSDSAEHLFLRCSKVFKALEILALRTDIKISRSWDSLLGATGPLSVREVIFRQIFVFAVYLTHSSIKKDSVRHPIYSICSIFVSTCLQLRRFTKIANNPDVVPGFLQLTLRENHFSASAC